jgi:hypothetical protein
VPKVHLQATRVVLELHIWHAKMRFEKRQMSHLKRHVAQARLLHVPRPTGLGCVAGADVEELTVRDPGWLLIDFRFEFVVR